MLCPMKAWFRVVSYDSVGAIVALRCVPLKGGWWGLTPEEASVPTPIPAAHRSAHPQPLLSCNHPAGPGDAFFISHLLTCILWRPNVFLMSGRKSWTFGV